jgi:acetoin utilization protein AcuB
MFVKDYMTRHPIMIEPDKRVTEAQQIMGENNIRHLPVVGDGKRLVGLITRSRLHIPPDKLTSLNVWEITRFLSGLSVKDVMIKGPDLHTINLDATLEEAAQQMTRHKIRALPVCENGIVVGILTETDLLVELQHLLGANEPGWRVTMRVPNVAGEASKLSGYLASCGWEVMALGSVRTPKDPEHWDLILKVSGNNSREELVEALKKMEGQEVVDVRQTNSAA